MSTTLVAPTTTLTGIDRARLQTVVHRGHTSARTRTCAQVMLKLGEGWSDTAVGAAFDVCRDTVKWVRARFLEGGVDGVLTDKVQERCREALTGEQLSVRFWARACALRAAAPMEQPMEQIDRLPTREPASCCSGCSGGRYLETTSIVRTDTPERQRHPQSRSRSAHSHREAT